MTSETPESRVSKRIEFDKSLMDRYEKLNPSNTLWFTMNRLLEEYVILSEAEKPGLKKYAIAASNVVKGK